jgi:DNA-binding Xre family transcriptional regulator
MVYINIARKSEVSMLVFNINRIMALRGIHQRYGFLVKKGFHRTVAANLANNRAANIKLAHLEKLCRLLNCTPNELFEFKSDANEMFPENHALNKLKREVNVPTVTQIMKEIPVEKLRRVEELLLRMKDEE